MLVIFKQYETIEPEALPRPGPTRMLFLFAQLTKSATTKKYVEYPFLEITDSSYSIRCLAS